MLHIPDRTELAHTVLFGTSINFVSRADIALQSSTSSYHVHLKPAPVEVASGGGLVGGKLEQSQRGEEGMATEEGSSPLSKGSLPP